MDRKKPVSDTLAIIILCLILPLAGFILLQVFLPAATWQALPLHIILESLGLFAGIALAIFILSIFRTQKNDSYLIWVASAFIAMGILDGFHSALGSGNTAGWLHSLAMLTGGFLFSMVWLGDREILVKNPFLIPAVTTGAVTVLGIVTFIFPQWLPPMVIPNTTTFTTAGTAVNILAGLLFFFGAAALFRRDRQRKEDKKEIFLAGFCLLNGLAALLSTISVGWSASFWFWHLLRVSAYLLLFVLIYEIYQQQRIEAEREVQESRERYRTLVETVKDWIWEVDAEGRYIYASPKIRDILGYEPEEILGKTPFDLMPPDEAQRAAGLFNTLVLERKPIVSLENVNIHKDGRLLTLETSGLPFFTETGELAGYRGIDRDITERKRGELGLQQSNEALSRELEKRRIVQREFAEERRLFTGGTTVIFKWRAESGWPVEYVSPNIESQFGYTPFEFTSGRVSFASIIHQNDLERVTEEIEEHSRNNDITFEQEYRIQQKGGDWRWIYDFTTVVRDRNGAITHYYGYILDITDRRQAEDDLLRKHEELNLAYEQLTANEEELRGNYDELRKTESALRDSEQKFRGIIDNSLQFIGMTTTEGVVLEANRSAIRFAGIKEQDVLGKYFWDTPWWTHSPDLQDRLKDAVKKAAGGETVRFEATHPSADGHLAYIDFSLKPVLDAEGHVIYLIPEGRDITERKKAEAALGDSEERYRQLVEHSPDAIVVHSRGQIVYINPACVRMFGATSSGEIIGRPVLDFVHSDMRDTVVQRIRIMTDQSQNVPLLEEKFIRIDGSPIDVEVAAMPIVYDGKPAVQVAFRDITGRKKAEAALGDSEERYRRLFESSLDGILVVDADTAKIIDANPAIGVILGKTRNDLLGRSLEDSGLFKNAATAEKAVADMKVFRYLRYDDLPFTSPDRTRRRIEFIGTTYSIFEKSVVQYTVRDITDRKTAEEALKLSAERNATLLKLNQMTGVSERELMEFAFEEGIRLTGSRVGYLATLNDDETVLTMQFWTRTAMEQCRIADKPIVYPLKTTGLWGEAVRQRRPVITNDYAAPNPLKKGVPEGHVKLTRHMNLPVFAGSKIVLVAGVGNKEEDYNETDVQQLTLLMEGMWRIIERKRAEDELKKYRDYLEEMVRQRTKELSDANVKLRQEISERVAVQEALNKRLVALTEPLESAEISFTDLFNIDDIQKIQDAFADAHHVASLITMPDGTPITKPSNFCRLCIDIIRNTDKGRANCFSSDAIIGRQHADGPIIQPCMSGGLWDAGASIIVGGRHVANWLIGQVKNEAIDEEKILSYARDIGADETEFRRALQEVPVMSTGQFEKVAHVLFLLANELSLKAYQNVQQARFITGRRKAEEALRRSERELADIINLLPDATLVIDSRGKVLAWNRAIEELTGVPAGEMLGKEDYEYAIPFYGQRRPILVDLVFVPDEEIEKKYYRVVQKTGDLLIAETDIPDLNGKAVTLWGKAGPLYDDKGNRIGAIESIRDITEQKKIEKALTEAKERAEVANLAKSTFLSRMSHELRTPLNAILGFTQILRKQQNITNAQKRQLEIMQGSGDHLLGLINDLLDVGKIEEQKITLEESPFSLRNTLQQAISVQQFKAEEKGLSLTLEIPGSLPAFVKGDERRLRQIILNLLSNAIKFTKKGGVILNATYDTADPGTLHITITDTGIGIPPDMLESIFDPFTQVTEPGRLAEGTGLGLTITRQLVTIMGGEIRVDSEPGKGSTFHVEIPLPETPGIPAVPVAKKPVITGYTGRRRSILVVDDDIANTAMLVAALEPLGFTVMTTDNGSDAVRIAGSQHPDLLLLDLVMPGMDGLDVMNVLKENPGFSGTRIIGISAATSPGTRRKDFITACDDFIAKPVEVDILLEKIRVILTITWETTVTEGQSQAPAGNGQEPDLLPPDSTFETMQQIVRKGDYGALEQLVDTLEKEDPAYGKFCRGIRTFINRYDDEGIISYLGSVRERQHDKKT